MTSTTITMMAATQLGLQRQANPDDDLSNVLLEACGQVEAATGQTFLPLGVLYSSSNVEVTGWRDEQRRVGSQDLTFVLRAATSSDIMQQLLQRLQNVESASALTAQPQISNVAAQVLNYAAAEPFRWRTFSKYASMGAEHPRIQQLSSLTQTAAHQIVQQADLIIARGNNHSALSTSAAAVEMEVLRCQELINRLPQLRQQVFWECWVLDNYAHIKTALLSHSG